MSQPTVLSRISQYWKQDKPGSFNSIFQQLKEIGDKAKSATREAISALSVSFYELNTHRKALKDQVEKLRKVQESVQKADLLIDEGNQQLFGGFQVNFAMFVTRVNTLKEDIKNVYRNALYPCLLVLQNAEKGWKPSGYLCQVCDYYSWLKVIDPESEINQAFPKK